MRTCPAVESTAAAADARAADRIAVDLADVPSFGHDLKGYVMALFLGWRR